MAEVAAKECAWEEDSCCRKATLHRPQQRQREKEKETKTIKEQPNTVGKNNEM